MLKIVKMPVGGKAKVPGWSPTWLWCSAILQNSVNNLNQQNLCSVVSPTNRIYSIVQEWPHSPSISVTYFGNLFFLFLQLWVL